jgi:hypothetical protein
MKGVYKNISGVWAPITNWVNHSSVWHTNAIAWIKIGGVWMRCKNILTLSDYDFIFPGASGYQESTVTCDKAGYPQFTVSADSGWITTSVYSGGVLVSNPSLYATGMQIRALVSALTTDCIVGPEVKAGEDWTLNSTYTSGSLSGDANRSGNVTVVSEELSKIISVIQGASGSDQLTFAFRSVDLGPGDTAIDVVITRGATTVYSDTTGTKKGRDGYTKTYTVTINETGLAGDTYTVTLSRH